MSDHDQARLLRELAAEAREDSDRVPTGLPALAVCGGKGGVGKTCTAVNLGILLCKMGLRPLLVDCDLGLANADVLLGLNPERTLYDVMLGGTPIGAAVIDHPSGLAFIPAASGREELTRMTGEQLNHLTGELMRAAAGYDMLILDLPAGIQREVIHLLQQSRIALLVVTPDPTSLTDAYAQIKVLEKHHPGADIRVLVNQCSHHEEGVATYNRLRKVVQTYLDRDIAFIGQIPQDRHVREAIRQRVPYAQNRDLAATQALNGAALRLKGERWK